MVHYAETRDCRRRTLLAYFSETFAEENCGGCDNCLDPKETFDGTVAAQKFLACLYRIRERSGFGFGLNHVVEVLTGANTEAIRKWGHDQVSTYGIGDEFGRDEWKVIGRELMRLGLAQLTSGRMSVVELTQAGRGWLGSGEPIELTRPTVAKPKSSAARSAASAPAKSSATRCCFNDCASLGWNWRQAGSAGVHDFWRRRPARDGTRLPDDPRGIQSYQRCGREKTGRVWRTIHQRNRRLPRGEGVGHRSDFVGVAWQAL